ncbi:MAG: tetratricopeptide repeat protein [Acidobacteriota bacterium]
MASRSPFDRLRLEGGLCAFPGWGLLRVSGDDRQRFLHSQLTSDVCALEEGATQISALLDASGRLRSILYLNRRADSHLLLVPTAQLPVVREALEARIFADDVEVEALAAEEMRLALGPRALQAMPEVRPERRLAITVFGQRGFVTWDDAALPIPPVDRSLLAGLGLLCGQPVWGVNVREGQLVNETVLLKTAVSRNKGCYLGQETVAKVRAHRGAAYASMLLRASGLVAGPDDLPGRRFAVAGRRGGTVVRAAEWQGETLLEVLLFRGFRVPGQSLECCLDDGRVIKGTVEELPALYPEAPEQVAAELWRQAVALFAGDQDEQAISLLETAIAVCPGFADAYETLGVIRGRRGELELAIGSMQKLLESQPHSVMAHANLSRFYAQLGRIEEAEEELQLASAARLHERRRTSADAAATAPSDDAEKNDGGREALLRRVLEIDAEDAMANFGMGEIMVRRGDYEEASEYLRRALAADASRPAAYLHLGDALEGSGCRAEAVDTWRRGLEVAATHGDSGAAQAMQLRLDANDASPGTPSA